MQVIAIKTLRTMTAGLRQLVFTSDKPTLSGQLRQALRSRHYCPRTEQTYCHWIKRCMHFHMFCHAVEMAELEIDAFLTHPAVGEKVIASTPNQALSVLLFLYRHVIVRPVSDLGEFIHTCKLTHMAVVMPREGDTLVPGSLIGNQWLMDSLLYGAGLRLMERHDVSRGEICRWARMALATTLVGFQAWQSLAVTALQPAMDRGPPNIECLRSQPCACA